MLKVRRFPPGQVDPQAACSPSGCLRCWLRVIGGRRDWKEARVVIVVVELLDLTMFNDGNRCAAARHFLGYEGFPAGTVARKCSGPSPLDGYV